MDAGPAEGRPLKSKVLLALDKLAVMYGSEQQQTQWQAGLRA